jgi:light-regulated signal transduction histidine kinase (bacteriophytochrome)
VLRQGVWTGETALRSRDGAEFPVSQVVLAHKDSYGEVRFLSTIMRDIRGQKHTEEELKRTARELSRSNTELEQFAYIASHDLQEPLRKVQAFGDMIASKYRDALGDEGRDYLQRMAHAAERMKILINDLLTFSRVSSRAKPFEPVDLNVVLRGVLSDLESRIAETDGRVDAHELATLDADALQMRQLLQNLIGNGLKFHRPNEPAVVQVHSCLLDNRHRAVLPTSDSEQVCQLTVEDNGIGFEQKYAERIFRPFERLHGRGEYEGTGIGLAVCRKIVERHGGSITAQGEPLHGCAFVVLLPVTHLDREPAP